jgi:dTMP kinase
VTAARWVALEGGEGSGKSTQAALLAKALGAVLTREPGGTPVGSLIRELLLNPGTGSLGPRTEALLMAADRAQHVADVVVPALSAGHRVVSDRSAWSFLAYQGYGRSLAVDDLWRISDWAADGRWPDLAILVDVPAEESRARLAATGRSPDRLEAERGGFHDRVRAGFAALTAEHPERWAVIDGTGPVEAVAVRVWDAFNAH